MNFRFFYIICLLTLLLTGCEKEKKQPINSKTKVQVAKLSEQSFVKKIHVQGNIQPIDSAIISAKVAGEIEEFKVDDGYYVKKGDVLFQIDRDNLENLVLAAEQALEVAEENCAMVTEDINIAEIALNKSKAKYKRALQLKEANVTSIEDFEDAEADFKHMQATYRRAQAVLNFTQLKVSQCKTNLQIAKKNLADSIVKAPYDGVITKCFFEEGEFVAIGNKVLKIEAQDKLELSARISALYYSALSDKTKIVIYFNNQKLVQTNLSYISPIVDPISRTFEIKALLPANNHLVSGTLCDVDIILAERKGYGIDSNAVIEQAKERKILFAVQNEIAKEIPVNTGFSTDGYIEILNSDKLQNELFVVSGHYFLNDGSDIEIVTAK